MRRASKVPRREQTSEDRERLERLAEDVYVRWRAQAEEARKAPRPRCVDPAMERAQNAARAIDTMKVAKIRGEFWRLRFDPIFKSAPAQKLAELRQRYREPLKALDARLAVHLARKLEVPRLVAAVLISSNEREARQIFDRMPAFKSGRS